MTSKHWKKSPPVNILFKFTAQNSLFGNITDPETWQRFTFSHKADGSPFCEEMRIFYQKFLFFKTSVFWDIFQRVWARPLPILFPTRGLSLHFKAAKKSRPSLQPPPTNFMEMMPRFQGPSPQKGILSFTLFLLGDCQQNQGSFESQNCRHHPVQPPAKAGPLQVAKESIQEGLEYLWRRRLQLLWAACSSFLLDCCDSQF